MIKLFGKKEKPVTVYVGDSAPLRITEKEFNSVVDRLKEQIENLGERNDKLERIIKYAPFDPDGVSHFLTSYRVDDLNRPDSFGGYYPKFKTRLYIYHNREEYAVDLEELDNYKVIAADSENIKWLNKKDSLVEFTVMTARFHSYIRGLSCDKGYCYKHTFAIDITTGKYLHKSEMVEVNVFVDDCRKEEN